MRNPTLLKSVGLTAIFICSQMSTAEPRSEGGFTQTVKSVSERVQRDIQDWTVGSDEGIERAKNQIREKFNILVDCDRTYLGFWGALSSTDCLSGLSRLESGLTDITSKIDRKYLAEIKVTLGAPGMWQGLTITDRQIKVPFNASPKVQATFIADEVALLYRITLKQLSEQNANYAKKISETYFIPVEKDPTLDVYQYHDGLKKAELAAKLIYADQKPSQEIAQSLGFDRLIIGRLNTGVYQENGELRIAFNYADHPGVIFNYLIKSVANGNGRWFSDATALTGKTWTWGQVVQFRRDRARVNELKNSLSQSLSKNVNCQLDPLQNGNIDMTNCREGLEKIKLAIRSGPPRLGDDVNQVLVTDLGWHNFQFDAPSRSLLVGYNANSNKIAEALGHK